MDGWWEKTSTLNGTAVWNEQSLLRENLKTSSANGCANLINNLIRDWLIFIRILIALLNNDFWMTSLIFAGLIFLDFFLLVFFLEQPPRMDVLISERTTNYTHLQNCWILKLNTSTSHSTRVFSN